MLLCENARNWVWKSIKFYLCSNCRNVKYQGPAPKILCYNSLDISWAKDVYICVNNPTKFSDRLDFFYFRPTLLSLLHKSRGVNTWMIKHFKTGKRERERDKWKACDECFLLHKTKLFRIRIRSQINRILCLMVHLWVMVVHLHQKSAF